MSIDVSQLTKKISEFLLEPANGFAITSSGTRNQFMGVQHSDTTLRKYLMGCQELIEYCDNPYYAIIDKKVLTTCTDEAVILAKVDINSRKADRRAEMFASGYEVADDGGVSDLLAENTMDYEEFLPLVDYITTEKFLLHIPTNRVSTLSFDCWFGGSGKPKFFDHRVVKLDYNPYDISRFGTMILHDQKMVVVNTYLPPKWRLLPAPEINECPECIDKLLTHLFPKEEVKEYALQWLKKATLNRCDTALVINGAKGTGKGVFSSLFAALVGNEHYEVAPKSLIGMSQFNSVLKNKRGIYIDEFKVTKVSHTSLKKFMNELQGIEGKGKDAIKCVTFNNFLITNNDLADMYIEFDDRRFSVLDTTAQKLLEIMSREEVKDILLSWEDDGEVITQFGHWLINREPEKEVDVDTPYYGETFHQLVYEHLDLWKQYLVDYIVELSRQPANEITEEELNPTLEELRTGFRKEYKDVKAAMPSKDGGIQSFVHGYVHLGIDRLGRIKRDSDNEYILVVNTVLVDELRNIENNLQSGVDDESNVL